MSCCPACDAEIDVDEFDVDRDDELSCPECGTNLVVASVAPVALAPSPGESEGWPGDEQEEAKPFH